MNRPNALPPAPLFKHGLGSKTPSQALQLEKESWQKFWQKEQAQWDAHVVLGKLRAKCYNGISGSSVENFYDMPEFTSSLLFGSAKSDRKISEGSDHWLASELLLPPKLLQPIAKAIDLSVTSMAWAHQMLCNLHPELLKDLGGTQTIAKTPKIY